MFCLCLFFASSAFAQEFFEEVPHKECPHTLAVLTQFAGNESQAVQGLGTWLENEYNSGQLSGIEVEAIHQEGRDFYIKLTDTPPKTNDHPGYMYYKISGKDVYGLYCD